MWTAALARNLIDMAVAKKPHLYKVKSYHATFLDKVKPSDALYAKIAHVGMKNGLQMIQIDIFNGNSLLIILRLIFI